MSKKNELATRLRLLRGELTLREAAEKIGRDYTQISKWELGKVAPRFDTLLAYSRVFKAPLNWILYGDDAPADAAFAVPAVSTGGGAISNTAIATAPGAMATTGAPSGGVPYATAGTADTAAQGAQPLAEIAARLQAAERRIAALEQSMLAVQSAVIRGGACAGALPGSTPSAGEGAGS